MSEPRTDFEREQFWLTEAVADRDENVVSTACPQCGTRFAMLARCDTEGWHLRCTLCGCRREGELKT
jgi:predicted RNA-binding Zn-ribbon protein involved in translation (DUF1610 family)